MADAETVIEEIRTDAAVTAGHVAAAEVVSEVAEVAETLDEHVEATEEQHEEIIGGNEWLVENVGALSSALALNFQTVATTLTAIQAAMTVGFQTLQSLIEARSISTASPLPIPQTEPEAIMPIVEPVAVVAVDPEASTTPAAEPRRRRRII